MYWFLLTRRWITAALVVIAAVVTMMQLGLWQLRRLDEVRSDNARVAERLALPAKAIDALIPAGADAGAASFRRATVDGRYEPGGEVLLANRSNDGRAGSHLLTPVRTADGRVLIVDRGWVPLDFRAHDTRPPGGDIRVTGVLFPSERKGTFGASIPPGGRVAQVPRVDVSRIAAQLSGTVFPLYLRLESQSPGQASGLPDPPGLPSLDEGSHLSYAFQWFIFATIAVLTFGALARRAARRNA